VISKLNEAEPLHAGPSYGNVMALKGLGKEVGGFKRREPGSEAGNKKLVVKVAKQLYKFLCSERYLGGEGGGGEGRVDSGHGEIILKGFSGGTVRWGNRPHQGQFFTRKHN